MVLVRYFSTRFHVDCSKSKQLQSQILWIVFGTCVFKARPGVSAGLSFYSAWSFQMIAMIVLGAAIGVVFCFLMKKQERNFREKLFSECEVQLKKGNAEKFISNVIEHKDKWIRSIALIRKPFNKQVNLAIETMAVVLALLALVNSLTNFDKLFSTVIQGEVTVAFLSMVLAFIPTEWVLSNAIDKDVTAVLNDLREAVKNNRLKSFLDEAKQNG